MARSIVPLLVLTLALAACETDASKDAVGPDTTSDARADVASDAVIVPDAVEPCPTDFLAADGLACSVEGRVCGGPCTDPCQFCNVLMCEGGHWTWMEAFPDPNCGDAVAEPAEVADTAPIPEVAEVGDVGEVDASDPCALVGCGAPPVCGTACALECGCCGCNPDEALCGTAGADEAALYCQGDCYAAIPCLGDDACVDAGPVGLSCASGFATCADVEAAYGYLTGDASRACAVDGDCQIVWGQCGVGLGGCWHAVNQAVRAAELQALGAQYSALFCTEAVCDCAPPPEAARCEAGLCAPAL